MFRNTVVCLIASTTLLTALPAHGEWYKGAMHVHSLRSDGDAAPEVPVSWYKEHGWNFVLVTEHNQMQTGERLRPITQEDAPTPDQVAALRAKFGEEWVVVAQEEGQSKLRLKTFPEVKARFDEPGKFLLVHGEEITSIGSGPHVGVMDIAEPIPARGKGGVAERAQVYFDLVAGQSAALGRPMPAVLNHPNFADAVTIEEMLQLTDFRFFEVYNGHPSVNNWGHAEKGYTSTDRMWDVVLASRLLGGVGTPLYGIATDDAHDYHKWRPGEANPGRGWVMVQATSLDTHNLIQALEAGDFYASTGVLLKNIARDAAGLALEITGEPGVTYTTKFLGTRKQSTLESREYLNEKGETPERSSRVYGDAVGAVLKETAELNPVYHFSGDELYVRAIIVSNKPQANPFKEGDMEMAWVQPIPGK